MTIQMECGECGKRYRFAEERAGETTECKSCGADLEIPGGRGRGAKRKKKKQSSGVGAGTVIGGGVALVALVGLVAFLMMGRGRSGPPNNIPSNDVAANPLVAPQPSPAPPAVANNAPATMPVNPAGQSAQIDQGLPGVAKNSGPANPGTGPVPGSGFKQGKETQGFKPVKDWKVQVDPLVEPLLTEVDRAFNIKTVDGFLQENFVTYPSTPSPFVLVGQNQTNKDAREVWNLFTGTKAGVIKGPRISGNNVGFSADGNYVAWFRHEGAGGGIEVYDIKAKKSLGAVTVDSKSFNVAQVCLPSSMRLVALSNVHRGIIAWKLPSGDLEWQIKMGPNGQPDPRNAFSPGGRYLAVVADFLTKAIDIYDLDTGEKRGSIEFADRGPDLFGMAFSRDGTELAAAYADSFSDKAERIVIWSVTDGSIRADFELPNPERRKRDLLSSKSSLQWFPDGKRLLLNGIYVIDREARDVVYAFPKQKLDFHTSITRRVLNDTTIADWEGTTKSATISPLQVKAEDIAHARDVAAAGGLLIDAKLPKLTPFDRDKGVNRTAMNPDWKAAPDPAPSSSPLDGKFTIKAGSGRVRELRFSRADAAIACLRFSDDDEDGKGVIRSLIPQTNFISRNHRSRLRSRAQPVPCRSNWLELYDAAKGTHLRRIEVDFPCELLAVSPEGSRIMVQAIEGEGRLDVFSADGSHVAGCRPFQNDGEQLKHQIASATFLDANTVAACSMDDRLVVIQLPGCEPVYVVDEAGVIAVSPGGKLLATCDGNRVELRESLTGDSRGTVSLEGNVQAMSYAPAGDRLAVLTSGRGGSTVAVIDLATGSSTSVPIPQAIAPLFWCGENEVLVGSPPVNEKVAGSQGFNVDRNLMLIDLHRKAVLWSFVYGSQDDVTFASETVDGRFWLAGSTAKGKRGQVTAVSLPEPGTKKLLTDKKMDAQTVVRPGTTVGLKFDVASPPAIEGYAQKARGLVDAIIKTNELTLQDGAPLQLIVTIAPVNATGTLELKALGGSSGPNPPNITVQRKGVLVRLAYEMSGKPVWEAKYDLSNDFFGITRLPQGKDAQTVLDESMWQRAVSILETNPPPSHVFAPEFARGLGTSRLTGEGPLPAKQ